MLQGKLETLALAIGRVGFYAGAFVAFAMSASYTQRLFLGGVFVEGVASLVRTRVGRDC